MKTVYYVETLQFIVTLTINPVFDPIRLVPYIPSIMANDGYYIMLVHKNRLKNN